MKLEYTNEETFITEDVEFNEEHYEFAKSLHIQVECELWSEKIKNLCILLLI
jgi:hypothetical protein